MIRLDKYLSERNIATRSQIKEQLKKGLICVNHQIIKDGSLKINEISDVVTYQGKVVPVSKFQYIMLNKPAGVISATTDSESKTVLDLLSFNKKENLFPVGRLDKDTEGLLLITNDGELSHNLLSPKKHVAKTYYVLLKKSLNIDDIHCLETGVQIGDDKPTLPAKVQVISDNEIHLTITEGRFHQVKRMLKAVNNEVVFLKRIQMGSLVLDNSLAPGEYRELTNIELKGLKG